MCFTRVSDNSTVPNAVVKSGSQTPTDIVNTLPQLPERTRLIILAPIARGSRGAHMKKRSRTYEMPVSHDYALMAKYTKSVQASHSSRNQRHDIDLVIDPVSSSKTASKHGSRKQSITALLRGEGSMLVQVVPTEGEGIPVSIRRRRSTL